MDGWMFYEHLFLSPSLLQCRRTCHINLMVKMQDGDTCYSVALSLSYRLYNVYKCIGDDTKAVARPIPNRTTKTNYTFCGTPVFVPLPKFWEINCFPTKYHWNLAIGYWHVAKNDFQYGSCPLSWIKIIMFGPVTITDLQNVLLYTKFHQNQMIFRWAIAI